MRRRFAGWSMRWSGDDRSAGRGARIWLAVGRTDVRKGFDGLAAQAQQVLLIDPFLCVGRDYVAEAA